jgi:hypothetical protein
MIQDFYLGNHIRNRPRKTASQNPTCHPQTHHSCQPISTCANSSTPSQMILAYTKIPSPTSLCGFSALFLTVRILRTSTSFNTPVLILSGCGARRLSTNGVLESITDGGGEGPSSLRDATIRHISKDRAVPRPGGRYKGTRVQVRGSWRGTEDTGGARAPVI